MHLINNLNSREKLLILLALPATVLILIYLYYWQPLNQQLNRLRSEVPQKQAVYAWMQAKIPMHTVTEPNQQTNNTQPALTIIENLAIQNNAKNNLNRVQPINNNSVRVWFENVNFDNWLSMIDQLSEAGFIVESTTVTSTTKGLANVRVTLIR